MTLKKARYIVTAVFFFSLLSCEGTLSREEAVKRVVGKYNTALAVAYKQGSFDSLLDVADGKALSDVSNTYQSYRTGMGLVMDSELLGLEFREVRLGSHEGDDKVEVEWHEEDKEWREVYVYRQTFVETEERWHYKWVDATTGEQVSPAVTARYKATYTIDNVDGGLKVVSVKVAEQVVEKETGGTEKWKRLAKSIHGH